MTKQEVIAPDREVEREKKSEKEEGGMADVMNLLSMVAGGVGMMMRIKWAAWCALFFALSSIANCRTGEAELRPMVTSIMFAIMAITMCYLNGGGK